MPKLQNQVIHVFYPALGPDIYYFLLPGFEKELKNHDSVMLSGLSVDEVTVMTDQRSFDHFTPTLGTESLRELAKLMKRNQKLGVKVMWPME
ncbi:uncharacterized protein RSE6_01829 [Rhynchosporium secalis]|uniref:Uncharacterized protein n=1 Tax=Rhynchosporium secalis TaxID=38038 RepID=A0A1E1LYQ5_RHYSE|nr:uncharacterized protein RSE6_01829 [Rhynchosporium secalis]